MENPVSQRWGGRDHEDDSGQGRTVQTEGSGTRDQQGTLADAERVSSQFGSDSDVQRRRQDEAQQTRMGGQISDVSNPARQGLAQRKSKPRGVREEFQTAERGGTSPRTDSDRKHGDNGGLRASQVSQFAASDQQWITEPPLGRVVDGVPDRLDRREIRQQLKALGNSIVPPVAALLMAGIKELEE